MQTLAEYALEIAKHHGASYADARVIEQETQEIASKDLSVSRLNMSSSQGIGIRVLFKGGWGFASTQDLRKGGIEKATRRAVEVARASSSCANPPVELVDELAYKALWVSPHLIDPFTISVEDKLAVLLESARIICAVKGITLAQGVMTFIKEKKYFASSTGSRIEQHFIRSSCGIEAYASNETDRQKRSYPSSFGGQYELAGWEMVTRWDLKANAQRIAEEAVQLLSAEPCPAGKRDLIIGSSQLALQIHESMGHPSELDRALGQELNFAGASFLTPDKLHKLQYGSPIVNLVADATRPGALGSFGFDDEGVPAQRVHLVKDGIFRGYLSSRDTAGLIGLDRSGGMMRAESWNYAPIIRMTNISLVPGNAGSLEDIVADTEDAILVETNRSWSIDQLRYNFQFSTEAGWLIKNGKRQKLLKNCSYGGITPSFWNSCDAIGGYEDYVDWGVPTCGKGQPCQIMWTGHGASPSRFRGVDVGMAHKG